MGGRGGICHKDKQMENGCGKQINLVSDLYRCDKLSTDKAQKVEPVVSEWPITEVKH